MSNVIRMKPYVVRGLETKNLNPDQYMRIAISVGQPYHEGVLLEAAVKWAKENFHRQVVMLADTLQRYNMILDGMDSIEALKKSREAGDAFLERHASILAGMEILRWDDILKHADYMPARIKVGKLYHEKNFIRKEMNDAAEEVAVRRNINPKDKSVFLDQSIQYLLEEGAGKAVFHQLYPGTTAYPKPLPKIWSTLAQLTDHDIPPGLVNNKDLIIKVKKTG